MNDSPSLPDQTNRTIDELTFLSVINTASDVDTAATSLTYQLINPPGGMVISTNGVITWTPSEAQGPSTNTITTVVMDDGSPALSVTNSFEVVVTEVNVAPVFVGTPTNSRSNRFQNLIMVAARGNRGVRLLLGYASGMRAAGNFATSMAKPANHEAKPAPKA